MVQPSDGAGERGLLLDAPSVVTEMAPRSHASHDAPVTRSPSRSANRRLTEARRIAALMAAPTDACALGWVESARSERVSMMDADGNED